MSHEEPPETRAERKRKSRATKCPDLSDPSSRPQPLMSHFFGALGLLLHKKPNSFEFMVFAIKGVQACSARSLFWMSLSTSCWQSPVGLELNLSLTSSPSSRFSNTVHTTAQGMPRW